MKPISCCISCDNNLSSCLWLLIWKSIERTIRVVCFNMGINVRSMLPAVIAIGTLKLWNFPALVSPVTLKSAIPFVDLLAIHTLVFPTLLKLRRKETQRHQVKFRHGLQARTCWKKQKIFLLKLSDVTTIIWILRNREIHSHEKTNQERLSFLHF